MALSVIGAGFGRTGTESMKRALEMLGCGPCYHMHEVMYDKDRTETWRAIAKGAKPAWDTIFSGYQATVDWPAAFFWRELSALWPDAKILLTKRDADSWYRSMENTILKVLRESDDPDSIGERLIAQQVFGGNLKDRDHVISVYNQNIADVQAAFGPDRLLTYNLGDGWEPLCNFLGKPIPREPYPRGNEPGSFHATIKEAIAQREKS